MTKADWLDFFEAINGRSATEEEIAAALAAGEFQDDATPTVEEAVTVDETAVQETVDSLTPIQETTVKAQPATPIQEVSGQGTVQANPQEQAAQPNPFAQGQTQQAPFVNGQPVGPGQQVQFINGQAVVVPAQPSAFVTTFKNYWTWLLNAWKRPADMTNYGKHNGWLNYIFLSVLTTFANFLTLRSAAGAATNAFHLVSSDVANMFSDILPASVGRNAFTNPIGVTAFFAVLFASFLTVFAYILAGFVVRKAIFRDADTTFANSFDRFGRMTALALPILLGTSLFALFGLVRLPIFLLLIVYLIFNLANIFNISPMTTSWKADKFYQWILAYLLNGAVLTCLTLISLMFIMPFVGQIISDYFLANLANLMQSLYNSY